MGSLEVRGDAGGVVVASGGAGWRWKWLGDANAAIVLYSGCCRVERKRKSGFLCCFNCESVMRFTWLIF